MEQNQAQQPTVDDIDVIVGQGLQVDATVITYARQLTRLMQQMAQEIQRLTKENNELRAQRVHGTTGIYGWSERV